MKFLEIFVGSLFFLNARTVADPADYCKLTCDDNIVNVACGCTKGSTCGEVYEEAEPNQEEREFLVKLHNQLRGRMANANETKVYMGASNMMAVQYDLNLEYVAMCGAKRCSKARSPCSRTQDFKTVGQNVYFSHRDCVGGRDLMEAFNEWFIQVRYGSIECFAKAYTCKGMDEFSQMVYANVVAFGCGRVQSGNNSCTIVCTYAPKLMAGEPMMKFGPAGSACPKNAPNVNGLCTRPEADVRSLAWRSFNGYQLTWKLIIVIYTIPMLVYW